MSTISKTQQFLYLQNKARHYDNLKKSKPAIQSFRKYNTISPTTQPYTSRLQQLGTSPYKHSIKTPHMKQYQQMKINESLVTGILSIRTSKKPQIYAQHNYSRYNDSIQKNERVRRTSLKFNQAQKNKQITMNNTFLGNKILKMKPSIGTMAEWNRRYENNKSLKKIASRYGNQSWNDHSLDRNLLDESLGVIENSEKSAVNIENRKKTNKYIAIYSGQNRYMPEHYRTFIGRDGSTVALKDKLFELPKQIKQEYFKRESSRKSMEHHYMDMDLKNIKNIENNGRIKMDLNHRIENFAEK